MRILIADFGQHVFEACRYLSKDGHQILLAVNSPLQAYIVNHFFRHIDEAVTINNKEGIPKITELKRIYDNKKCDVFFPFGYYLVTDYFKAIESDQSLKMNSPYGSKNIYWDISDKNKLYSTYENTDFHLPFNYGCVRKGDKLNLEHFPVIVKKTRGKGINGNVILAWNIDEVYSFLANADDSDEFVIQQYIAGHVYDVGGFSINGDIYYHVPQRRTVTLPLRGGVAAVNDICDDPILLDKAKKIMKISGWTGPFQIEFRQDPSTGIYYIIEINAKMWGSSPLSLKANPDLLKIALDVAVNKKPERSLQFKKNLRYRWLFGQELQAISFGKLDDIIAFIGRFSKKSYYDFDLTDPVPDIAVLSISLYKIFFNRKKIPSPLIDCKKHKELNQK